MRGFELDDGPTVILGKIETTFSVRTMTVRLSTFVLPRHETSPKWLKPLAQSEIGCSSLD